MPTDQTTDAELDEIAAGSQETRDMIRVRSIILTRRGWPAERVAEAMGCSLRLWPSRRRGGSHRKGRIH